MADTKYSISWDAYQNSICHGLSALQQRGEYVDMTLAADGHHVKAHQMVLSLVSPYIKDLIASAACPHPVIFLNKVSYRTLQSILQYAYTGEVVVSNDMIQEFLNACKELHVKGLEESMDSITRSANETQPQASEKESRVFNQSQILKNQFQCAAQPKSEFSEPHEGSSFFDNDDDMIDPFDNNEELDRTAKSTQPVIRSTIADTADTTLKYTISNMGMAQLVLNRYIYFLRHPRKNGETMWRCINYKRKHCRAYIDVKDLKVVKRSCAHNHPYHDAQILKKLRNRNLFSTMNEVQRAIESKKKEVTTTNIPIAKKTTKADTPEIIQFDSDEAS